MRIFSPVHAWLVLAALALAAPAYAFEPTVELSTPADAYRFGVEAYRAGDLATATDALDYAAEQGHLRAKWMLGRMYARGEGVDRDDGVAFSFFAGVVTDNADDRRPGPDAPFVADSLVALGDYYRVGGEAAGEVNLDAARQLYWEAATFFNNPEAQYNLATMYYQGEAGEADPAEAARWALLSAEAGNPSAQALLGFLLFQGDGIARQPVVGLAYLHFAWLRTGGADEEIRRFHELAMSLATETERRTALELANGWLGTEIADDEPPEEKVTTTVVERDPPAAAAPAEPPR